MELKFRSLKADEIDCRVAMCKESGLSLLLYKDARVDQNILDETVGPMNWQRRHTRDNANCIVSLWDEDKQQWIEKEDTGTESFTEAEKGLASDSFKRACFNWGIGRELYTAPFIWISSDKCSISKRTNSKGQETWVCFDRFVVVGIEIKDGKITSLAIANASRKMEIVFSMGRLEQKDEQVVTPEKKDEYKVTPEQVQELLKLAQETGTGLEQMLKAAQIRSEKDITPSIYKRLKAGLLNKKEKQNAAKGEA